MSLDTSWLRVLKATQHSRVIVDTRVLQTVSFRLGSSSKHAAAPSGCGRLTSACVYIFLDKALHA